MIKNTINAKSAGLLGLLGCLLAAPPVAAAPLDAARRAVCGAHQSGAESHAAHEWAL